MKYVHNKIRNYLISIEFADSFKTPSIPQIIAKVICLFCEKLNTKSISIISA